MGDKIVLYYPKRARTTHTASEFPLPLIAISTFLAREGYPISIITDKLYSKPIEQVLEEAEDALCLGITSMTGYQIADGLRVARLIKEKYPRLPIIWGGWHPTIEPESTNNSPCVDIVVRGQGERTFTELVHALSEGKSLNNILGISYKENGIVSHNPERPIEDINNYPGLPYSLIDVRKLLYANLYGNRVLTYHSSYGCPWHCTFCTISSFYEGKWSGLEPHRMVEEIDKLVKDYQIDSLYMADSEFFIDVHRVRVFCEELIRKGVKIRWFDVNSRVTGILKWEEDMWELLAEAGCVELSLGVESGYQPALNLMRKDLKVEQVLEVATKAARHNMRICCAFVCGIPWDQDFKKTQELTDIDLKHTLDLSEKIMQLSDRNMAYFFMYTPYPGNPLYQRSLEIGLKAPQDLEGWAKFDLSAVVNPWITAKQAKHIDMFSQYIFPFLSTRFREAIRARTRNKALQSVVGIVYKSFKLMARFRLRHRFFTLPIDYWLLLLGWRTAHFMIIIKNWSIRR